MRLLYVIPYYLPALDFGGPVSVCADLAQGMARRGHTVTVLTTDAASRQSRVPVRSEKFEGIHIIRLPNVSQALVKVNLFTPARTGSTLARLLRDTDVVHIHEFFAWPCFRAATAAAKLSRPVLLSGHGSINLSAERGRETLKRIWHRLFGARTLSASTMLQAATLHEAEHCKKLGVAAEKIRIIPHGVPKTTPGDGAAFRARYETGERPIFLFVGRLLRAKGVDLLLQVARRFAKHPSSPLFVLVGPPENRADLSKIGYLTENVLLTGALHGSCLADAYRAAGVFVLPSFAEGMPLTALEALAFGLPTVLSTACNLPEIKAAGAGLQMSCDARSLFQCVERMLAMRDAWPAMSAAARELAINRFDLRRVHDHYEAVYSELAGA